MIPAWRVAWMVGVLEIREDFLTCAEADARVVALGLEGRSSVCMYRIDLEPLEESA